MQRCHSQGAAHLHSNTDCVSAAAAAAAAAVNDEEDAVIHSTCCSGSKHVWPLLGNITR